MKEKKEEKDESYMWFISRDNILQILKNQKEQISLNLKHRFIKIKSYFIILLFHKYSLICIIIFV